MYNYSFTKQVPGWLLRVFGGQPQPPFVSAEARRLQMRDERIARYGLELAYRLRYVTEAEYQSIAAERHATTHTPPAQSVPARRRGNGKATKSGAKNRLAGRQGGYEHICPHCGVSFRGRKNKKFCCETHRKAAHRAKPGKAN